MMRSRLRFPSLIDRYVLGKFVAILIFAILAMTAIFVAVNYVENTDKFIDRKVPGDVILDYYLNYIPYIITLTLPVDVLLACLFSVGSLSRYNELTAVKSTGVSVYRVIMPVMVMGLLISLTDFWLSEEIVPQANIRRTDLWKEYVSSSTYRRNYSRDINLYSPDGVKVLIERFDKSKLTARNVSVQWYYGYHIIERVDALEMKWDTSRQRWVFRNGSVRKIADGVETFFSFKE